MSVTALSPNSPVSSGEIQAVDFSRAEEVHQKHELLVEYLRLNQFDSLLLIDPANYAWITGGASNRVDFGGKPIASILITPDARVVLCNNVDSGQIFDRDLAGLGFLLKERSWTEGSEQLLRDVCRGRRVACDVALAGTDYISDDLRSFRMHFSENELHKSRELGLAVAHAVEATARNFSIGATEAEIAGHLAHRLIKNRIEPVRLQVMADGQGWRYRHWRYGDDRIERYCVISAIGNRHGLHSAATRTVCLSTPPTELESVHQLASLVQATGIYFSRAGWNFTETWKRVARIYDKFDIPDEWRSADLAHLIGYESEEVLLKPASSDILEQSQLIHWHPSVRSVMVGDTFLITSSGVENLTPTNQWPVLSVSVKGAKVDRPGILVR